MKSEHQFWIEKATELFTTPKPQHCTDYTHCEECNDHDQTLCSHTIETITMHELGNPVWDPLCFITTEAMHYYFPALIRLTLESIETEFYLEQFLFHLEGNGKNHTFMTSCNELQRNYIVDFMHYLIEAYPDRLDYHGCSDDVLRVCEIWAKNAIGE